MSRDWVVAPFCAVRYNKQNINDLSSVVAPPYDVISEEKQKKLYASSPYNIVRLDYGVQLPTDQEKENRYTRAQKDFEDWQQKEILIQDKEPSIYLYEQSFNVVMDDGHTRSFNRRGFFALRKLEEFSQGNVLPHEKTLSGPKQDRLELMRASVSNLSSIFGLYHDPEGQTPQLLGPSFVEKPVYEFTDEGKIHNKLWKVSDPKILEKLDDLMRSKKIFIADGHHRYETAIQFRNEFRKKNPDMGPHSVDYVLMFFAEMSDPGLLILPTHRVIQNWTGFSQNDFLTELKKYFSVRSSASAQALVDEVLKENHTQHKLGLAFPGEGSDAQYFILEQPYDMSSALGRVETSVLHEGVLRKVLKMTDEQERNSNRLRFIKDTQETLKALKEPETNAIFLVKAPQMDLLRDVAEEKHILPPKTTYFYPKILTGLLIHKMARLS